MERKPEKEVKEEGKRGRDRWKRRKKRERLARKKKGI